MANKFHDERCREIHVLFQVNFVPTFTNWQQPQSIATATCATANRQRALHGLAVQPLCRRGDVSVFASAEPKLLMCSSMLIR